MSFKKIMRQFLFWIGGERFLTFFLILRDQIKISVSDNKYRKKFKLSGLEKEIIKNLKRKGYYVLPNFLDSQMCEMLNTDIHKVFENNKDYLHVADDVRLFGIDAVSDPIYSLSQKDIFKNIAKAYCPQCFSFVMANVLKYKNKKNKGSGGGMHRDTIFGQIKFMIYLTDCDETNGYFEVIEKSHLPFYKALDAYRFNFGCNNNRFESKYDEITNGLKNRHKRITGRAGTLIIFDNSLIHAGHPIEKGERVAITYYFARTSVFESLSAVDEYLASVYAQNQALVGEQKIKHRIMRQLIEKDVVMDLN